MRLQRIQEDDHASRLARLLLLTGVATFMGDAHLRASVHGCHRVVRAPARKKARPRSLLSMPKGTAASLQTGFGSQTTIDASWKGFASAGVLVGIGTQSIQNSFQATKYERRRISGVIGKRRPSATAGPDRGLAQPVCHCSANRSEQRSLLARDRQQRADGRHLHKLC